MAAHRAQLAQQRHQADQAKARMAAEAAAKAQAAEAERVAAEQRAQALASMTPQLQQIEALREACADWAAKLPPQGNFKKQEANRSKAGFFQEADKLVKTALADAAWNAADRCALADMLEQALPTVVVWDAKKHRKELQLSVLRGTA